MKQSKIHFSTWITQDEFNALKESLPSNILIYPTTTASDIWGYFKLVTSTDDPDFDSPAVDVTTWAITSSAQLIAELATDSSIISWNPWTINLSTIWNIRKTSGSWEASFYYEVYKRDSWWTETLIATSSTTAEISATSYEQFSATASLTDGDLTDMRIVLKFYANRWATDSDPTYDFQFWWTSPVRTLFPVPFSSLIIDASDVRVTPVWDLTADNVQDNLAIIEGKIGSLQIQRNTTTATIDDTAYQWNWNTDSAWFTYTLPAWIQNRQYKIVNTWNSGNILTITPNWTENLLWANSSFTLNDWESLVIGYDSTDWWY